MDYTSSPGNGHWRKAFLGLQVDPSLALRPADDRQDTRTNHLNHLQI